MSAFGLLLFAATAQIPAAADAPRLFMAEPANGAVVAPGEMELRWTFDRPMRRDGWSVTGRPESMPKFVGEPSFSEDGRTFVQRMRLEPGRTYDLGVNSARDRDFRAADGTPAVVARVRFSTSR